LFLITCLLIDECTYHKFDNTQAHWGMNFIGRRRNGSPDIKQSPDYWALHSALLEFKFMWSCLGSSVIHLLAILSKYFRYSINRSIYLALQRIIEFCTTLNGAFVVVPMQLASITIKVARCTRYNIDYVIMWQVCGFLRVLYFAVVKGITFIYCFRIK
jgi:hypothetical protein